MRMQTQWAYYGSRFLSSPLEAMFTFLIFILSKELDANPLQLTLLAASKPFVSIFAFYLNAFAARKVRRLPFYLAILNAVGCILCFLFPLVVNAWFFIASYMIFMTCLRAAYPIWMEILKSQFGVQKMGGLISKGTSINYGLVIFIPMIASVWMDQNKQIWQWMFVVLGLLQLLNSFLLILVQMESTDSKSVGYKPKKFQLLEPLKEGWKI
ncbi:MAG TPA: MFS transporter, partial [Parachlamydiaceae bacterium]|nr:MFS transporter [Parachlamydiaceae bacterium]